MPKILEKSLWFQVIRRKTFVPIANLLYSINISCQVLQFFNTTPPIHAHKSSIIFLALRGARPYIIYAKIFMTSILIRKKDAEHHSLSMQDYTKYILSSAPSTYGEELLFLQIDIQSTNENVFKQSIVPRTHKYKTGNRHLTA